MVSILILGSGRIVKIRDGMYFKGVMLIIDVLLAGIILELLRYFSLYVFQ